MCVEQEENDENNSHEKLTLSYLYESIRKLIEIGCQLETEILNFNQADLNVMYKELQDRNSELEMLLSSSHVSSKDTHDEIGNLKYELSIEKEKCENIYNVADQKDTLIMKLESTNDDLSKTVNQYKEKLVLYEEQVLKLSADLKCLSDILSTKESEICSLKKTIKNEALTYEDTKLKCKEYESKINLLNSVISKSDDQNSVVLSVKEKENNTLRKAIEEKESQCESIQLKCKEYENEIQKLNSVISLLEDQKTDAIMSKKEEIGTLRKTMEEEAILYENIQLQCKEYESKIQLLNSINSKLEEEKALDKHFSALNSTRSLTNKLADEKSPSGTISELKSKIELLKKSNNDLILTIKTMKNELNTAYEEKQDIEESGKLITAQNVQLKDEVSNATKKYIFEKKAKEELVLKLKESDFFNGDSGNVIDQLKIKNERLEKDIGVLKGVLREHEKAILSKNSCLKTTNQIVDQLNLKISEMEREKLDFELNLKSMENPLKVEVEDMTKQCSMLAAEIERLQLVEVEKLNIEKIACEMEIQRDALISESNLLQKELEDKCKQLKYYEVESQELKLKNNESTEALNLEIALRGSLEEQLAENESSITNLNAQLLKLKSSEEKLKLLNSEQSKENCELKQKMEVLERELKEINIALKQSRDEHCHQRNLATDYEELVEKLKISQNETKILQTNFQVTTSALNNATQFIKNLLEIIIVQIESYSDYLDFKKLKSSLASLLAYLKQGSTLDKSEKLMSEVFDNLNTFYRVQTNNYKEDMVMKDHIISIMDSVTDMGSFCKSNVENPPAFNFADVTNMSMFETTVTNFSEITKTPCSPRSLLTELQQTKRLLEECFNSLKTTTFNQAQEIERLNLKLSELASKSTSNTEANEKDYPIKGKYHLIKVQFKRLERDYNELVDSSKDMEEQIKTLEKDKITLEKEKQSLDEEAEELAEEIKRIEAKYNSSNELVETLTELASVRKKLHLAEDEVYNLKLRLGDQPKDEKKVIRSSESASYALGTTDSKENVRRIGTLIS